MSTNPFSSKTFNTIWCKYFNDNKAVFVFNFLKPVAFYKHALLPCFINVGNKLTNGLTYSLNNSFNDFKKRVFLIRDIPSYQSLQTSDAASSLQLKKVFQYEGYITRITEYDSLDEYLKQIFKSNSRSKFRRNIKRLEACFDVEYKMYHGTISLDEFQYVFDNFYKLFEKRYTNKGEPCGELDPTLWQFYTDLAYKMINESTASLFVIYCNKKPVGITFSYHFNTILVEALTVFDIDYYRYNIGHTTILKMLDWSFKNGIKIFDYTQGDFDYKKRWSSDRYKTYYHILYDSKSIKSSLIANFLVQYFNFKRVVRERKYSDKIKKIMYVFSRNKASNLVLLDLFEVCKLQDNIPSEKTLKAINLEDNQFMSQRKALFDYLYKHPEPVKDLKTYLYKADTIIVFAKESVLKIAKDAA